MNKRKMIRLGMILLIGLMLTGCAGYYGGYAGYYGGYQESSGGYISNNPHPSYSCPGDYGIQYCAR